MTRAPAVLHGTHREHCNAIALIWFTSNLDKACLVSTVIPANAKEQLRKLHPVGHLGQLHDIGNTVAFLISGRTSFINGEAPEVNAHNMLQ